MRKKYSGYTMKEIYLPSCFSCYLYLNEYVIKTSITMLFSYYSNTDSSYLLKKTNIVLENKKHIY